jgi:hypothetical protein
MLINRFVTVGCIALASHVALLASETMGHTWKQIRVPGQGSVAFFAPDAWRVSAKRATEDSAPTIEFGPPSGDAFSILITLMWRTKEDQPAFDPKKVRAAVELSRDMAARSALSPAIDIHELAGESIIGYYFTATDSKPPRPGDWRYMTQGSAILDTFLLTFTVLSNDGKHSEANETLAMLKGAKHLSE